MKELFHKVLELQKETLEAALQTFSKLPSKAEDWLQKTLEKTDLLSNEGKESLSRWYYSIKGGSIDIKDRIDQSVKENLNTKEVLLKLLKMQRSMFHTSMTAAQTIFSRTEQLILKVIEKKEVDPEIKSAFEHWSEQVKKDYSHLREQINKNYPIIEDKFKNMTISEKEKTSE